MATLVDDVAVDDAAAVAPPTPETDETDSDMCSDGHSTLLVALHNHPLVAAVAAEETVDEAGKAEETFCDKCGVPFVPGTKIMSCSEKDCDFDACLNCAGQQ
jgi:hypothetical protein